MAWSESIAAAVRYIEDHLLEPLEIGEIAPARPPCRRFIFSAASPCSAA